MNESKLVFQKPGNRLERSNFKRKLFEKKLKSSGLGYPFGDGDTDGFLSSPFGDGDRDDFLSSPFGPANTHSDLSHSNLSRYRKSSDKVVTLGYLSELPDFRDITIGRIEKNSVISKSIKKSKNKNNSFLLKSRSKNKKELPSAIDLRKDVRDKNYFTPVEDQGELGSCTANAVIGLVEYLIKAEAKETINLSRLFLYKVTRNLMHQVGDNGAYIRTTIKALKLLGCPPEDQWPYDIETFDYEPDAFLYSIARNFKAIKYLRLDNPGESGDKVLVDIKACIADGFPAAFGFSVFASINEVTSENDTIPFPDEDDQFEGGHAVLAIGYDDTREALLIRNSWGEQWGNKGYAWLPYKYVEYGLAKDFWTILTTDWVMLANFS